MFKVLVYITLLIAASVQTIDTETMIELGKTYRQKCMAISGVPEAMIDDCRAGKFAEDTRLKCYMKCLFDTQGMTKDDGTFDVDKIVGLIPSDLLAIYEPIIRNCGNIPIGVDSCDTAFLTHRCYYNESPEVYFIF